MCFSSRFLSDERNKDRIEASINLTMGMKLLEEIDYIFLHNLPAFLEKSNGESIWARSFVGSQGEDCQFNFLIRKISFQPITLLQGTSFARPRRERSCQRVIKGVQVLEEGNNLIFNSFYIVGLDTINNKRRDLVFRFATICNRMENLSFAIYHNEAN